LVVQTGRLSVGPLGEKFRRRALYFAEDAHFNKLDVLGYFLVRLFVWYAHAVAALIEPVAQAHRAPPAALAPLERARVAAARLLYQAVGHYRRAPLLVARLVLLGMHLVLHLPPPQLLLVLLEGELGGGGERGAGGGADGEDQAGDEDVPHLL